MDRRALDGYKNGADKLYMEYEVCQIYMKEF